MTDIKNIDIQNNKDIAIVKGSIVYLNGQILMDYDPRSDDYAFTRARDYAKNYNLKNNKN